MNFHKVVPFLVSAPGIVYVYWCGIEDFPIIWVHVCW